ncbi:MAG: leucine-rich repeat domain-containing protein, partial [Oscillospiraceae bacterium]|nr:leucine-rich repeat domain-containing protein [Oscillospiraceae bacterium]
MALLLTIVPVGASAAEIVKSGSCGDSATYTLDADGVLRISGSGTIGSHAFEDNDTIKQVVVEAGISAVGYGAFYDCDSLTSVTLPEGLTSIGDWAFENCDSLTSVTLPEGLT